MPFGSAFGRLVLYEDKSRISKADFELRDDGGSIRSSIWEVTWHEDYVEVILSGDEQFDGQIILYFDGRKEIKQLTDKEEHTESGDINEIEGITSQAAYESEPEQSFDVTLDDWGEVKFVSCKLTYDVDPREYASFFLLRDDQIVYRFPYRYREKDNTTGKSDHIGSFDSVGAVAFRDVNNNGKKDIIIICYCFFGAGPTGMVPRPDNIIYLAGDNEFILAKDIMEDVKQHIPEKEMTIENICNYLNDSN